MKPHSDRYSSSNYALYQRIGFFFFTAFSLIIVITIVMVFTVLYFVSKNEMRKDLSTLANLIGINCAAPILFSDQKAAQDILSALQAIPQVKAAYILNETNEIFAGYDHLAPKKSAAFFQQSPVNINTDEFRFWKNRYYLFSPISFEGKIIGRVYIESDLERVYTRLRWFAGTAMILAILFILIVGFLFKKLDSAITALKESENRYRRVFENTGTAMFICDEDGTISMVNAMFEKVSGQKKEALEQKVRWADLAERYHIQIEKSSGQGDYDVTWRNLPGSNKHFYVKTDFLPGTRSRIVSVIDITEIKKAEEELRKSEKLKTEFIYTTSHELRTPIQSMLLGVSDLLEAEDIRNNLSLYEDVELVANGVKRLAQLVENLLDLSQIETSKTRFVLKESPVNQMIDHVLKEVAPLAESYRHEIRRLTSPWPDRSILVDKGKIEQVFSNLIGNAIKFTPEGGVILLDCKIETERIRFFIADNGYGIPEHAQRDIFKKFFQAESFTPDHVGGIGLGLTICKHIVEGHQGEITCISPVPEGMFPDLPLGGERQGSLFTFYLPMASQALQILDPGADDFRVVKAE